MNCIHLKCTLSCIYRYEHPENDLVSFNYGQMKRGIKNKIKSIIVPLAKPLIRFSCISKQCFLHVLTFFLHKLDYTPYKVLHLALLGF